MNLIDRVKRILLSPRTEWEVIDAEPTTPAQLYTGYIMPLAAIGPIAQIIGYSVFGISVPFTGTYRVPMGSAIEGRRLFQHCQLGSRNICPDSWPATAHHTRLVQLVLTLSRIADCHEGSS